MLVDRTGSISSPHRKNVRFSPRIHSVFSGCRHPPPLAAAATDDDNDDAADDGGDNEDDDDGESDLLQQLNDTARG